MGEGKKKEEEEERKKKKKKKKKEEKKKSGCCVFGGMLDSLSLMVWYGDKCEWTTVWLQLLVYET
jgi:hypothetical protein